MTRVTATEARKRLFQLLDAVEKGEEVIVERRGVCYQLRLDEPKVDRQPRPRPEIEIDPEILDHDWSWVSDEEGQLTLNILTRQQS